MKLLKSLYVQVLIGIAAGVILGFVAPERGAAMRPLGDGFIKLVKMLIAPIVFSTVVVGIAHMGAMKEVGRIGIRALIYFEVVSTIALVLGMVVVNIVQPGSGLTIDPATLDMNDGRELYLRLEGADHDRLPAEHHPEHGRRRVRARRDPAGAALLRALRARGAVTRPGRRAASSRSSISSSRALFAIVGIVMRLAPIGAFGAMAFTVGRYGVGSLLSLGQLMAGMYVTCLLFVFVILGGIARATGFSLIRFLKYISEEILIVLGTSSSESALPKIMEKLERIGCPKPIVGLVIPTGYSFNLDGTSIYMTMGALFVAQASGVHLSFGQQLSVLGILLLTSKGAAAVTGAGFITLAATLSAFPNIPIAGLALLLGVDRFMSEARSITNLIGNAVATMVVARWEGALDMAKVKRVLAHGVPELHDPADRHGGRRDRGAAEGASVLTVD